MTGVYRLNVEAGQSWAIHYLGTPPEQFKYSLEDAEKDEWYRLSTCIGNAAISKIEWHREFVINQSRKCTSATQMCRQMLPEGHIIQQATSLAEMATITDKASYFHDPASG